MNGDIVHAPLHANATGRILDVGCGTGIVTNALAKQFTSAEVWGVDLSPACSDSSQNVVNTKFMKGDILTQNPQEWTFAGGNGRPDVSNSPKFIYTYSRLLICGVSDWSKYIKTCFELLQPGGYSEIHDLDWVWLDERKSPIGQTWGWLTKLRRVQEGTGLDYLCGSRAATRMKDAGFTDITV